MDSKILKIGASVILLILATRLFIFGLIVYYVWNYMEVNKVLPDSDNKIKIAFTNTIDKLKTFFLN